MSFAKPAHSKDLGSKTVQPSISAPAARWSKYWVLMWIVIAVGLLAAAPFMAFWDWWTAVAIAFGIPEFIGARVQNDAFPPLTHVIVRYVHAEIAMPLLFGLAGGIGAHWIGYANPDKLGMLVGLIGWFNAHFLLRYVPRREP